MKMTDFINKYIKKLLIFLQLKTYEGKPNYNDAPEWAKYVGFTPEGYYFWLQFHSPVQNEFSDEYFPSCGMFLFTGYYEKNSKYTNGFVKPISFLKEIK